MFKRISTVEAHELIEEKAAQVVDIRDPQSYGLGHIVQALNLTNDNLEQFISETEKQKPVIVVCYHGNSSQQAAQFLAGQGFTDVYSMDGGFEAWKQQYPVSFEE